MSNHVNILLTIDSVGIARAGYGGSLLLSHNAQWPGGERTRTYTSSAGAAADWPETSPEYRGIATMFAQTPRPTFVKVGRMTGSVTQRYDVAAAAVAVGRPYSLRVRGQGVTDTTITYTPAADLTFVDADVNVTTNLITETAHGMTSGDGPYRLSNAGGALPTGAGIAADTNVWIHVPTGNANQFGLATSKANALAGTLIDITAAAGGGTHTLRRAQNDVIIAQLVQRANDVPGKNYTATQIAGAGETDTMRVTANTSGAWFVLEVVDVGALSIEQSHDAPSDVTIGTDLSAILQEDPGFYAILTHYNSQAYVSAVAAWTAANKRIYVAEVSETDAITTAVTIGTDTLATLFAGGTPRTMGCYHHRPAQFFAHAWMGRWLPTPPGSATPKFKTLAGTPSIDASPLTDTHRANLVARRGNGYERVTADLAFTFEGTVPSTEYGYLDVVRNGDWFEDEISKGILGVFAGNDIVPHTPEGYVLLEGSLRGSAALAEAAGVLAPGWVVESDAAGVTPADRAERNYRGLKLSGTFAGAVHKAIPVTVTLTL